jgi:hypothetical protein
MQDKVERYFAGLRIGIYQGIAALVQLVGIV